MRSSPVVIILRDMDQEEVVGEFDFEYMPQRGDVIMIPGENYKSNKMDYYQYKVKDIEHWPRDYWLHPPDNTTRVIVGYI